jgi:hypothetical protein
MSFLQAKRLKKDLNECCFFAKDTCIVVCLRLALKGVPRDFRLLVFFMNPFPQAPEYMSRVVSNFFENLRRYIHKVEHRCR